MDKSKWEYKKLGEVCQYSTRRFDVNKLSKDNYVGVDNLLKNYCGKVPASSLDKIMSAVAYNPHDVLIGNIRPYLKKIWLADSIGGASGDVLVLQIKNTYKGSIYPRFLYYTLANDYFFNYNYQHSKGVKMPRGDKKEILKYAIQLPTIDIQKNIAFTLDQLSAIISLKQQQMKEYDALAQSLFYEMFGDPMENPNRYPILQMKEVCSLVTDGTHNPPHFSDNGIPFILVSNIKDNEINFKTKKFINEEDYNALWKSTPIEKGDLLYTCVGSYGNPAIVMTDTKFMFQRHISLLKIKRDQLDSYFMLCSLNTPYAKLQADRLAKGIAQKTVTLTNLKKMKVMLPPLSLQRSFAEKVKAIEHQKSLLKQSIAETQTLLDSRMQEYFG